MILPKSHSIWIRPIRMQNAAHDENVQSGHGVHVGVLWNFYEIRLLSENPEFLEGRNASGYLERWEDSETDSLNFQAAGWVRSAYLSNHIPHVNGVPLHFLDLSKLAAGKKALGVFKADVDRLGLLLSFGLRAEKGNYSLAEYMTVSRSLEAFFGERLTVQLRSKFPNLYTVFSGGDDVFLIGPWSEMPEFAIWLRNEFQKFVNGNPEATLSAGMLIVHPRTPMATMAHQAERELEKAKDHPNPFRKDHSEGRDQISIWGIPMEWDDFVIAWNRAKQWVEWAEQKVCSHQFFRKLLQLAEMRELYAREGKIEGLRYVAMLNYTVQRMMKEYLAPEHRIQREELLQWVNRLHHLHDTDAERDWYLMPVVFRFFELFRMKEGEV